MKTSKRQILNSQALHLSAATTLFLKAMLGVETLTLLIILQNCWHNLSMFRDDIIFRDLPSSLRLFLPTDSLNDSTFPWIVPSSILIWCFLGFAFFHLNPNPLSKALGVVQCQIAQILVCYFWSSEIGRLGITQVAGTYHSDSWRFHITCGLTILTFVISEAYTRIKPAWKLRLTDSDS